MIDDRIKVDIKESDVRVDTLRASGAGGQHVNKTEIGDPPDPHPDQHRGVLPERPLAASQPRAGLGHAARALYEMELKKREAKAAAEQAAKTDIGWGHQIRSYVLQPYQMVKDLRTGVQTSNTGGRARRRPRPVHGGRAGAEAFGTGAGRGRGRRVTRRYASRDPPGA